MIKLVVTHLKAPWPAGTGIGDVVVFDVDAMPAWAAGKCRMATEDDEHAFDEAMAARRVAEDQAAEDARIAADLAAAEAQAVQERAQVEAKAAKGKAAKG